jgi:dTDP-4-dehydrorhamnose 3,5-epimerase
MRLVPTDLPGVTIIEPQVVADDRGYFREMYNQADLRKLGLDDTFVQDNLSQSSRGVLRGLHFQKPHAQAKLVTVLAGSVYDVTVDLRLGSPTYGKFVGVVLSSENKRQLYIPRGFAHGFCVTSDTALFMYKCSDHYAPDCEGGVLWNDPDIGIRWPIERPTLSAKDGKYPRLRDLDRSRLFEYRA